MLLTCDKYSLICLVETYLNLSDVSALLLFNSKGYTLFRLDRNIHAGGVLIICKNYLNPIRIFYSTHLNIEYICLDINFSNTHKNRIICSYRPPSTDIANHQGICDLISYLCNIHYPSILLGDFKSMSTNSTNPILPNFKKANFILMYSLLKNIQWENYYHMVKISMKL